MFKLILNQYIKFKIFLKVNVLYPKSVLYKNVASIISGNIKIGKGIVIEKNVQISSGVTSIGDYTFIGRNTFISSCSKIGKFCSISYDVKIGLISHPLDYISTSPVFYAKRRGWVDSNLYNESVNGNVEIGNDVLISSNVTILSGVKIGNGAVIGAGAVVNKDVPAYAIVAGVPAKIIKYRFEEGFIKELEQIKWWDFGEEILKKHVSMANTPSTFINSLKSTL